MPKREDLLRPVGSLAYEVEAKDSLLIQGKKEIAVVLHLHVEDNEGKRHKVLLRMTEEQFGQFLADVSVDVAAAKRGDEGLPPSTFLGGAPSKN